MFSLLVLLRPTESLVDCSLEVESPTGVVLLELSDVVVVAELDDGPGSDSYLVPLGHEFLRRGNEFYSRVLSPVK